MSGLFGERVKSLGIFLLVFLLGRIANLAIFYSIQKFCCCIIIKTLTIASVFLHWVFPGTFVQK